MHQPSADTLADVLLLPESPADETLTDTLVDDVPPPPLDGFAGRGCVAVGRVGAEPGAGAGSTRVVAVGAGTGSRET